MQVYMEDCLRNYRGKSDFIYILFQDFYSMSKGCEISINTDLRVLKIYDIDKKCVSRINISSYIDISKINKIDLLTYKEEELAYSVLGDGFSRNGTKEWLVYKIRNVRIINTITRSRSSGDKRDISPFQYRKAVKRIVNGKKEYWD